MWILSTDLHFLQVYDFDVPCTDSAIVLSRSALGLLSQHASCKTPGSGLVGCGKHLVSTSEGSRGQVIKIIPPQTRCLGWLEVSRSFIFRWRDNKQMQPRTCPYTGSNAISIAYCALYTAVPLVHVPGFRCQADNVADEAMVCHGAFWIHLHYRHL